MFNWLRRRRRLSAEARRKLLIAVARSEEAIVDTHVANALDLMETLADEVDFDRGIELYVEMMSLPEDTAATVANRLLARLDGPRPARRYHNVFRSE